MSQRSFAPLSANLLARKGEAIPSNEPQFGSRPWQKPAEPPPSGWQDPTKVRPETVEAVWPAPKPPQVALPPAPELALPVKTTIRLTHAQARAVRLAALVLDRPQQDILTAGLLRRLEALSCTDLANCSCFRAVVDGLKAPPRP